jgi:hypothetical protein
LKDHRDLFERYGEVVVGLVLAGGYNPAAEDLRGLYSSGELKKSAGDWLQERGDAHERRENRLETIEVAILLFFNPERASRTYRDNLARRRVS